MLLVRPELPLFVTESDLEDISPVFQSMEKLFVISSQNKENITVLVFSEVSFAEEALALKSINIDGKNYSLSSGHLTDNWASQHTVLLDRMFMISPLPSTVAKEGILEKMPPDIRPFISKVQIYEEKHLAILTSSDADAVNSALKLSNITLENKVSVTSPVYLVVQLPSDHEDISASRFTDNEELRYSLRSLEKHAPWVRHIFIVTNGQIPQWLNLDNPRISIVTHRDIFPNVSHLPTFSSPAIECHLHRIPNLSDKFLYLNDDVLFGKNVWPEDFYTHTKGQKVYLSWPVPNCAEGCPSSWIRDGYCDKPCNNSHCQWDGGDCTADNPMLPFQNVHQDVGVTSFFHNLRAYSNKAYCNSECADTWLADRYCDKACNVRACGFDAGDCGVDSFHQLTQLVLSVNQSQYYLPKGECVGFFNLSNFLATNHTLSEGSYEESPAIRSMAISLKYLVIGIVLHPDHNTTNLTLHLKGSDGSQKPFERTIHLIVDTQPQKETTVSSTVAPQTEETFTFEEFSESMRWPKLFTSKPVNSSSHLRFGRVNVSASNLPKEVIASFQELEKLLDEECQLRPPPTHPSQGRHLPFGDSLRHVNKLYNEVFGYEARKVPSHIAHFVDKNVMSRLTNEFGGAFDVTSSHKIRSSNDMQFAFSYYYYLMSEMETVDVTDIFRSFDVDNSGTWSDREIRTVLTRLYDLPLDFTSVAGFEQMILNCSLPGATQPATLSESYYDSKMPPVSEDVAKSCPPLSSLLTQHFGSRKRNAYEVVGEEEVAFKMIHNNLTQVLGQIDDLRKNPKKFVCLNDNMNHGTQEAELIRAVIQDFYESLFPSRSQFELVPEYRNRFLYVEELEEWRGMRDIVRAASYLTLALLIIFSLISFWKTEMREPERYPRLRSLQNRHSNPHLV